jgi:hypothetical protein
MQDKFNVIATTPCRGLSRKKIESVAMLLMLVFISIASLVSAFATVPPNAGALPDAVTPLG